MDDDLLTINGRKVVTLDCTSGARFDYCRGEYVPGEPSFSLVDDMGKRHFVTKERFDKAWETMIRRSREE